MVVSGSRFIDQLPGQGLGAFRVLLFHGIEQGAVQVEHRLPARTVEEPAQYN